MGMFDLTGRVALVTGGAGMIGAAIVAALEDHGATVIAADLTGPSSIQRLDVTDPVSWQALAADIGDQLGSLDVLVNCAGIAPMGKLEELDLEVWRRAMAVNVDGVAIGMQTCLPLLRVAGRRFHGGASIINIASAASVRASPFSAAYCASKAAVAMLTKVAALEFRALGYDIRVNSVHPGVVRSPMMEDILCTYARDTGESSEVLTDAILNRYPIKRFAEPSEVAAAVIYLASSEAAFVHASEHHVDGGYLAN